RRAGGAVHLEQAGGEGHDFRSGQQVRTCRVGKGALAPCPPFSPGLKMVGTLPPSLFELRRAKSLCPPCETLCVVMPGLGPGIHALCLHAQNKTWMAGSSQVKPGHDGEMKSSQHQMHPRIHADELAGHVARRG